MENNLESTTRFSDRVENYVKYRPHYPAEVFSFLQKRFQLGEQSVIADIGSGTGISAGPLIQMGCTVYAVEPNQAMRAAAEKMLGGSAKFKSVEGTAEATTLPANSMDLVIAAQAFHWFDPKKSRTEFHRILKPAHHVVLMWNERIEKGTPFLEGYEQLLRNFGTDYEEVKHQNVKQSAAFERLFEKANYEVKLFSNSQSFDFEGIKGRLLSSSYAPNSSHPQHAPMLQALLRLFEKNQMGGRVEMTYETALYLGTV